MILRFFLTKYFQKKSNDSKIFSHQVMILKVFLTCSYLAAQPLGWSVGSEEDGLISLILDHWSY